MSSARLIVLIGDGDESRTFTECRKNWKAFLNGRKVPCDVYFHRSDFSKPYGLVRRDGDTLIAGVSDVLGSNEPPSAYESETRWSQQESRAINRRLRAILEYLYQTERHSFSVYFTTLTSAVSLKAITALSETLGANAYCGVPVFLDIQDSADKFCFVSGAGALIGPENVALLRGHQDLTTDVLNDVNHGLSLQSSYRTAVRRADVTNLNIFDESVKLALFRGIDAAASRGIFHLRVKNCSVREKHRHDVDPDIHIYALHRLNSTNYRIDSNFVSNLKTLPSIVSRHELERYDPFVIDLA
jgi:hypothetical protein